METTTRTLVVRRIRGLMGENQVSQTALAKVLRMSQPALSRRFSGEKAFDLDELDLIAEYFEVPITSLFPPTDGNDMRSGRYPLVPAQELVSA